MKFRKIFLGVKNNVLLGRYTTFKIGGPAKYFFIAKSKEDLIKAIKTAKKFNLPFYILGGGSNLLVSDRGYKGIVIKYQASNIKYQKEGEIFAQAGTPLQKIVSLTQEKSLTNLEWAVGIPGTIGGAIYGNAGAFGSFIADNIKKVEVLDTKNMKIKNFSKEQCRFKNKESIFKKNKSLVILSVLLKLKRGRREKIKEKIKNFLTYKEMNQPLNFPSAGCVFKNYQKQVKNKKLVKEFPELEEFNKRGLIPASYLIDKSGLKGKKVGGAKISEKHANFIINTNGAKAKDVIKLMKLVKEKVKNKFGIKLEEEIQYLK